MENISIHMRISGVAVSNDDVDSRTAAAASLATTWSKEKNPSTIVQKVAEIADSLGGKGLPTQTLGKEVQTAVQKKSSSFLYEERPLDVSVCAGMAAVKIFGGSPGTGGWLIVDVYAAGLWSALAFQPTLDAEEKRENLRREVLAAAADWIHSRRKCKGPDTSNRSIALENYD